MTDDFASRDNIIHGDQVGGDKFSGDKVMGDKYEPHYHYYAETPAVIAGSPPMMALAPPSDYVQRSEEFDRLIDYLLASKEPTVAITATIRGAGGFGKTTLAQAICQDARIRAAFPDGILWTTVGDEKANVLLGLRKLYQAITGREARFVDEYDAATQLSGLLAERCCLIVIDDVWNAAHLTPFLEGGQRCARLVTTRIASVVPKEAEMVSLDAMRLNEAAELLGAGLANSDLAALSALAQRLGEWPLLLKLVNRRLYEDVEQHSLPLADAIASVHAELDAFGLTSFDVDVAEERQQAVAASMGVGLQRLKSDARYGRMPVDEAARFLELAIFSEDTPIPLLTLDLLWGRTGGLSEMATERLCRRLADLALILRYDKQAQTILLHDVTRHYLMSQASPEQLVTWHNALLDGYRAPCDGEWWRLPDDGFVYQNLLWHLQAAQQQEALETLLFTYRWLDAKLQATDIVSLIRDFDWRRDKQRHSRLGLLENALQMSVSVLARDKDQLVNQLHGRLLGLDEQWELFVEETANQKRVRWLQPKAPCLTRPGGNLLYTLSGHTDGVDNLLLTPDGRLISSSSSGRDFSVKVWDLEQGLLLHSLDGHTAGVSNLLLTPDGRLISSCNGDGEDTSIKVWDIEQGLLIYSLEGHIAGVDNLLLTPDGLLASSCSSISSSDSDTSVKIWDIETGLLQHSLEGHTSGVSNLLLTPDGRLISSCSDSFFSIFNGSDASIKVWDIETGLLLHSLEGHTAGANNLLLTSDDRLVTSCDSGIFGVSGDTSVKVWDLERGVLMHSLEGHTSGVSNLLITPNGHLISSCSSTNFSNTSDTSVKIWNIASGSLLHSLEGHTVNVSNLLLDPNGRLISSCNSSYFDSDSDTSIKVWDVETGLLLHSLEGHNASVSNLLLTPDDHLISSSNSGGISNDTGVKVWDLEQGVLMHSLEGHMAGVSNLLLTPEGSLISYCNESSANDTSVKVWDIETGLLLHSLEGHTAAIANLLLTPDGRLISCYGSSISNNDSSVKVWIIEPSVTLPSVNGHTSGVDNLLLTSDSRLITSCSRSYSSVKVWDLAQGALLHSLEGHTNGISKLLLTPGGRLITSCSRGNSSVKVWDLAQGVLLHSLEGHADGISNLLLTRDDRLISSSNSNGGSDDKSVKVWDLVQGVQLYSLDGHAAGVDNILLTPDGKLISSGNRDFSVKVWDLAQGVLLHSLDGHADGVSNLLLTPDGRLITSCHTIDSSVKVWDIKTGLMLHSLEGHKAGVSNLLLTSDGCLISSCSFGDSSVKIWDIETGVLLHSLEHHTNNINKLLLTPNGRLISSSGYGDTSIKVWDIKQRVLLHSLEGHKVPISNLLLTPNGFLISAGSFGESSVKVWNIETGGLLHSLEEHIEFIRYMNLSHVSSRLITSAGSQIIVWDWVNGDKIAEFTTDGAIYSCKEADDGTIVAGDGLGRVHFLRLVEPESFKRAQLL